MNFCSYRKISYFRVITQVVIEIIALSLAEDGVIFRYSGAPASRRAAKRSPITIGTRSHACIEIETHATIFPW